MKRWNMDKRIKLIITLLFVLMFAVACSSNENESPDGKEGQTETKENVELTISAAASLKDAMDDIQKMYKEEHPEVELVFNFGGSGSLQQQISQGAPADLFFSAAEDKFELLVEEGFIAEEDGVDLLGNTLVLIVEKGNQTIKGFKELTKAEVDQISLGTPESVPAGQYATEVLKKMALWDEVESKVIYAKDVRQVLSYVETGNVAAGIVYKTDALTSEKVSIVESADIKSHTPIIYPVGIIKDSDHYDEAKEFYEFLQADAVLKVFEEYGFTTK